MIHSYVCWPRPLIRFKKLALVAPHWEQPMGMRSLHLQFLHVLSHASPWPSGAVVMLLVRSIWDLPLFNETHFTESPWTCVLYCKTGEQLCLNVGPPKRILKGFWTGIVFRRRWQDMRLREKEDKVSKEKPPIENVISKVRSTSQDWETYLSLLELSICGMGRWKFIY